MIISSVEKPKDWTQFATFALLDGGPDTPTEIILTGHMVSDSLFRDSPFIHTIYGFDSLLGGIQLDNKYLNGLRHPWEVWTLDGTEEPKYINDYTSNHPMLKENS